MYTALFMSDVPLEKLNNQKLKDLFSSIDHELPSESTARRRVEKVSGAFAQTINPNFACNKLKQDKIKQHSVKNENQSLYA